MFGSVLNTPLIRFRSTEVFYEKKILLKISQNSQPQACNFINNETLAQVFSGEFCEVFKNTDFTEHPWTTSSEDS